MSDYETDAEILARWEALDARIHAAIAEGVTRAEHAQLIAEGLEFMKESPRHAQAGLDAFLRKFPDGPPPGIMSERMRQRIMERIVRPAQKRRN
jgi:hypothetical protein